MTSPQPDPVTADLAEVRRQSAAATAGSDVAAFAVAEAVPRLLAAVEAALAFHTDLGDGCTSCVDAYGERIEWPCDEYKRISAALLGEDAGNAST